MYYPRAIPQGLLPDISLILLNGKNWYHNSVIVQQQDFLNGIAEISKTLYVCCTLQE